MPKTQSNKSRRSLRASLPMLWRIFSVYILPQRLRLIGGLGLALILGGSTAGLAQMAEPLMNEIVQGQRFELLPVIAAGVLALFLARAAAMYVQTILIRLINITFIARLQMDLHTAIIGKDMAVLRGSTSGQLLSRIVNDVNQIRGATVKALLTLSQEVFTAIALLGVMVYQDWLLALIALILLPTAGWAIARLGTIMRKVAQRRQQRMGRFTDILGQQIQGFKQIKIDSQEAESLRAAQARRDEVMKYQIRAAHIRASMQPIIEVIAGLLITGIILYAGGQIASGAREVGGLTSFIAAFAMLGKPIRQLGNVQLNIQNGLAAADRVFAIIDTSPRVQEKPGAQILPRVTGHIALADVSFSYDGVHAAVENVDLVAQPGEKIALVGPSGAGKSTIINLIPRLYDPESGSVRIDGYDIRDVTLESLRAQTALVSQDVFLFTDTVAKNIAFAREDADRAAIQEAARSAHAHDFIMALPEGYDTMVGEQGMRLSGGQRQRLAIARALLKDAPILLLDEATAALDSESEAAVQAALANVMAGRTALVIAHRLATVANADCIYVMDGGRIVEKGTHDELIARNGLYTRMANLQFGEPAAAGAEGPAAAADAASGDEDDDDGF